MQNIDWKTKFRETKIIVGDDFLETVEDWWNNARSPLVMEGGEATGKLARASAIAAHSGLHVVKISCSLDLTFEDLYGTAGAEEFYPGTLGEILLQNKDTCLILDTAEHYPNNHQMIGALITFCEDRKIRFGKKAIENKDIVVKVVLTTNDMGKLDFLLKPWIYAKNPGGSI